MRAVKRCLNNNETGSAYIYVLITMLFILSMLRISIIITNHGVLIADATYRGSNLYHIAKSGIDKGVYLLNNVIFENRQSINNEILEDIRNINFRNRVIFISGDNPHSGNFHIKPDELLYKNLFINHANIYISSFLRGINNTLNLQVGDYNVDIFITYNIARQHYTIISTATHEKTSIHTTLEATLVFNGDIYSEIIHENYKWNYVPHYFMNIIYRYANFYNIFNLQISLNENSWSPQYPIFFSSSQNLYVDISMFYKNNEPINTVIIHSGIGNLYIYTSNEHNNKFNGVIISSGNIIFIGYHYIVEGNLISGGGVYYYSLGLIANNNILLDINFERQEDRRKLYDSLFLTNYLLDDGRPLRSLDICSKSPIKIKINTPISLGVLHMFEQT